MPESDISAPIETPGAAATGTVTDHLPIRGRTASAKAVAVGDRLRPLAKPLMPRHIYGSLDQRTFNVELRVDYSVTPDLTVQYYGAPFVSAGKYDGFRRITRPRARDYEDRFAVFTDRAILDPADGNYHVDEDGNGTDDYVFADPAFNVRDFNSNLVVRWAYPPGSAIYLVWSQTRSGFLANGDFAVRGDMNDLFDVQPHNVFLVKINRWFNL